jgi:ribosomal protein S24E
MQIQITEESQNPFFKRKELTVVLKHDASTTPSKAELTKALAGEKGVDESQVIVKYISTKRGFSESVAKVSVLNEAPKKAEPAAPANAEAAPA